MSIEKSREEQLRQDVDKLKNPEPYKEKYVTPEVQELMNALDILGRLETDAYVNISTIVPYEKLRDAKRHLDNILREQFSDKPEEK